MGSKAPSRVRIPQSPPFSNRKRLTEPVPVPHNSASAPVAQLDRAPGYELGGRRFESFRARHHEERPMGIPIGLFFLPGAAQCAAGGGLPDPVFMLPWTSALVPPMFTLPCAS